MIWSQAGVLNLSPESDTEHSHQVCNQLTVCKSALSYITTEKFLITPCLCLSEWIFMTLNHMSGQIAHMCICWLLAFVCAEWTINFYKVFNFGFLRKRETGSAFLSGFGDFVCRAPRSGVFQVSFSPSLSWWTLIVIAVTPVCTLFKQTITPDRLFLAFITPYIGALSRHFPIALKNLLVLAKGHIRINIFTISSHHQNILPAALVTTYCCFCSHS